MSIAKYEVEEAPGGTSNPELEYIRQHCIHWERAAFVGCGGNYFYVRPYLEVKLQSVDAMSFVDGDKLEEGNASRQWPGRPLESKSGIALDEWPWREGQYQQACMDKIQDLRPVDLMKDEQDHAEGYLFVCLPDNDQARLAVMQLAENLIWERRVDYVGVVVGGTDIGRGQAYWGLCRHKDGFPHWVHDWRTLHRGDVEDDGGSDRAGCGQRPLDNLLTGATVALALDDLMSGPDGIVREFYWGEIQGVTRIWAREI